MDKTTKTITQSLPPADWGAAFIAAQATGFDPKKGSIKNWTQWAVKKAQKRDFEKNAVSLQSLILCRFGEGLKYEDIIEDTNKDEKVLKNKIEIDQILKFVNPKIKIEINKILTGDDNVLTPKFSKILAQIGKRFDRVRCRRAGKKPKSIKGQLALFA